MMDNVYRHFLTKEEGQFARRATIALTLANRMQFNFFRNDISSFADRVLYGAKIKAGSAENTLALRELFTNSIGNFYYGKQYLAEPIEKRINYGGFKFNQPSKSCLRKISSAPQGEKSANAASPESCTTDSSNQREWSRKMVDYWLAKNYVFGSDGYELGSEQTTNYIKYLHSLYHMSLNGFQKMREFVTENMPVGRHGALVWMDNVSLSSDGTPEESIATKGQNGEIDSFGKYFRSSEMEKIFNPFFNRAITVQNTTKRSLSAGHIGAYAPNGAGQYVELFGFRGLYTENLGANELPQHVAEAIFRKFKDANPTDNKNYLNSTNSTVPSGISFGELMNSPHLDLEKRIDEFSTLHALKLFLQPMLSALVDEVWPEIEKSKESLSQIKSKIKEKLKGGVYSEQIKAASTRFSGLLQNPEKENSMNPNKPFLIPTDSNETAGNVIYVTQVNAYDFRGGFLDFVKAIGTDAFVKTVVGLAAQNKAMDQSTNFYLSLRGMII